MAVQVLHSMASDNLWSRFKWRGFEIPLSLATLHLDVQVPVFSVLIYGA